MPEEEDGLRCAAMLQPVPSPAPCPRPSPYSGTGAGCGPMEMVWEKHRLHCQLSIPLPPILSPGLRRAWPRMSPGETEQIMPCVKMCPSQQKNNMLVLGV